MNTSILQVSVHADRKPFDFSRLFHGATVFLVAILPFHVFVTVFLQYKLGFPSMISAYKEILVLILFCTVGLHFYQKREWPKFDTIDFFAFGYMGILLLVSIFNRIPLAGFMYGGRMDFLFVIVFLIYKHGKALLSQKVSYYLRVFLISSTWMLILSILVRFVFKEGILLHFGFSPNISDWQFGGSVPIYHGIPGANIRRFQGILDGPNAMAYFLIVYVGLLVHYFRTKKDWLFLVGCWVMILFGLLFLTYTRSALLGAFGGIGLTLLVYGKTIVKKYPQALAISVILAIMVSGLFYLKYQSTMTDIIERDGSSKGHFERLMEGLNRFKEHPFGEGLATSGPAYRYVLHPERMNLTVKQLDAMETHYIPESWYVQQLVEGGLIGFVLFMGLMALIWWETFTVSAAFFAMFTSVLIMNLVLHTFESAYVSIILFLFLGMYTRNKKTNEQL